MRSADDVRLDEIDVAILELLQKNARIKRNEIAEKVGLSLPSASDRLRKLEEQGIVTGYHAKLDAKRLGRDITAFVVVTVDSSRHFHAFVEHASGIDEILECHAVTGTGTHLLKVRTENTGSLERLLAKVQSWLGVVGTATSIVLSSPKESTRLRITATK
jgi:Lrp/AsnC family transcriptional regulator, leucine-responsive regulatory protein